MLHLAGHTNGKLTGSSDSASCRGWMCFPPVKTSNLWRCERRICAILQFTQSQWDITWDIYLIAKFPHKYELVKIHSKLTKNTKTHTLDKDIIIHIKHSIPISSISTTWHLSLPTPCSSWGSTASEGLAMSGGSCSASTFTFFAEPRDCLRMVKIR